MILNAAVPELDDSFTLDDSLLAQRKAANARRLYTAQIPALRAAGFVVLSLIAILQGLTSDVPFPPPQLLWLVALNLSFAALAWLTLRFGYGRSGGVDLSFVLFHLDVLVWLFNLYHLEESQLFFAYFLLVRVVDQVGFGFRRAIYFGHVVTAAYLAYAVWIAFHEPARALWSDRVGIAAPAGF